jgi:hypothetical protein
MILDRRLDWAAALSACRWLTVTQRARSLLTAEV